MPTTVQKWGNSLGVRIPKAVAEQMDLREGTQIEFHADHGDLIIRPRRKKRRKYKLSELLAEFKPRHRQGEIHNDEPRGRELI